MTGFNVNRFRAEGLVYGGARPTLYTVMLTFPPNLDVGPAQAKIPLLVAATEMPASLIEPIEVGYFGRKIKYAGDRVFQDWRLTILNDEDFLIRNAMEKWHNAMNAIISNVLDPDVSGVNPAVGNSYKVDATVTQFRKTGPGDVDGEGAIKTYKFNGLFPIAVDAIGLGYDETNTIERFDVTFSYDWWEPHVRANDTPQFDIEPL